MRLLQLATGPDELVDLHPNVTVVTGLDPAQRHDLAKAITLLARGTAPGPKGLLEAHGVLFDFSDEMLRLLDLDANELQPVVRPGDLPTRRALSPAVQDLQAKQEALTQLLGQLAAAAAVDVEARAALERAAARTASMEGLTAKRADLAEERGAVETALAALVEQRAVATAHRVEVDAATAEVRAAKQAAAARTADLAAALDQAALARDGSAGTELAAARATLRAVEAAVEAERAAEAHDRAGPPAGPSLAELEVDVARLGERRTELERALTAFHPVATEAVELALAATREPATAERVTSPEALAVAEQLDALDRELGGLPEGGLGTGRLADAQTNLDDARQALLDAEQAVRTRSIDRGLVDRLEVAHAELLEAIEKADTRFGGARAQRRVAELRAVEHQVLEEARFSSYSDYMMGNSLLHVDPEKERVLDEARAALDDAEDAARRTEQQNETELTRAALLDRRRALLDRAHELLGRPVGATGASEALRLVRVEGTTTVDHRRPLRDALEQGGVALGDDDLDLEDLTAFADAWLEEVGQAVTREQSTREELVVVESELATASEALATQQAVTLDWSGPDPELERVERVAAATLALEALEARLRLHQDAEREVEALSLALAEAAEEERAAIEAAAEGDAAMAAAEAAEEPLAAEQRRLDDALGVAARAEAEAGEALQGLTTGDPEADHAERATAAAAAAATLASLEAERTQIQAQIDELQASLPEGAGEGDGIEGPVGEEVEWYLLARLAAQRAVSLAGSVPLLLDDALQGLEEGELHHLLGRLERMSDSVQVIVVSEDPSVTAWAIHAGEDRAAVVYPSVS